MRRNLSHVHPRQTRRDQRLSLVELLNKHRLLDAAIEEDRGSFLSDWNGAHPFMTQYAGACLPPECDSPIDKYVYYDNYSNLARSIIDFHKRADGILLAPENILMGPGSSSLLVA